MFDRMNIGLPSFLVNHLLLAVGNGFEDEAEVFVFLQNKSMGYAFRLAQAAHDDGLALSRKGVLDEEEVVQTGLERIEHSVATVEADKVVDVVVLTSSVVIKSERVAFENKVVVARQVDGKGFVDTPS